MRSAFPDDLRKGGKANWPSSHPGRGLAHLTQHQRELLDRGGMTTPPPGSPKIKKEPREDPEPRLTCIFWSDGGI